MGFLYPTEELKTYGYQTQTNVKYVLVLSDTMASDANIHQFFKHFHKIWVAAVRTPPRRARTVCSQSNLGNRRRWSLRRFSVLTNACAVPIR